MISRSPISFAFEPRRGSGLKAHGCEELATLGTVLQSHSVICTNPS